MLAVELNLILKWHRVRVAKARDAPAPQVERTLYLNALGFDREYLRLHFFVLYHLRVTGLELDLIEKV